MGNHDLDVKKIIIKERKTKEFGGFFTSCSALFINLLFKIDAKKSKEFWY